MGHLFLLGFCQVLVKTAYATEFVCEECLSIIKWSRLMIKFGYTETVSLRGGVGVD